MFSAGRLLLFRQIIKYGLVGIVNTALTALVIWLVLRLCGVRGKAVSDAVMLLANGTGYVVGLGSSFLLNRRFTFHSRQGWGVSLLRFLAVFLVCYLLQLGVVMWADRYLFPPGWEYLCQLTGILVYSTINFFLNKYYTFRSK